MLESVKQESGEIVVLTRTLPAVEGKQATGGTNGSKTGRSLDALLKVNMDCVKYHLTLNNKFKFKLCYTVKPANSTYILGDEEKATLFAILRAISITLLCSFSMLDTLLLLRCIVVTPMAGGLDSTVTLKR
jgi:hypothetical protein